MDVVVRRRNVDHRAGGAHDRHDSCESACTHCLAAKTGRGQRRPALQADVYRKRRRNRTCAFGCRTKESDQRNPHLVQAPKARAAPALDTVRSRATSVCIHGKRATPFLMWAVATGRIRTLRAYIRRETVRQKIARLPRMCPLAVTIAEGGVSIDCISLGAGSVRVINGSARNRQNARLSARANGGRRAIPGLPRGHVAGDRVRSPGEAGAGA